MTDDTAKGTALVLGARVLDGGQPSAALKRRALHAARLYREGRVACVIASGGPPGASPSEAEVIRRLCRTAGVPDADIVTENQAATTQQNIAFSLPLLRAAPGPLWIVTDRYHAPRARLTARASGLFPRLSCPKPTGTGRLRLVRFYLREGVAFVVYAVRVWRGTRRTT